MRSGCSLPRFSRLVRRRNASGEPNTQPKRYRRKASGKLSGTLSSTNRPVDDVISAPRRRVKPLLKQTPRRFKRGLVGVAWHAKRLGGYAGAASKRQVDRGAVPVVDHDAAARCDRAWIDRAPRSLCELNDTETSDARYFG